MPPNLIALLQTCVCRFSYTLYTHELLQPSVFYSQILNEMKRGLTRRAMWRSPHATWLCVLVLSLMASSATSDEKQDPHEMSLKELREGDKRVL